MKQGAAILSATAAACAAATLLHQGHAMPPFSHALAALSAVVLILAAALYAALANRQTMRAAPLYCAGCALGAVLLAAYAVGGRR